MGDGGSGAKFCLMRVVVVALPDGLADAVAEEEEEEEEEEEVAILLASDANETRMGRACGGGFGQRGFSPSLI